MNVVKMLSDLDKNGKSFSEVVYRLFHKATISYFYNSFEVSVK